MFLESNDPRDTASTPTQRAEYTAAMSNPVRKFQFDAVWCERDEATGRHLVLQRIDGLDWLVCYSTRELGEVRVGEVDFGMFRGSELEGRIAGHVGIRLVRGRDEPALTIRQATVPPSAQQKAPAPPANMFADLEDY